MHTQVRHFQQIRKQNQNPKPTNNNNYYKQTKETSSVHVRKTDCIGRAYSLVPVTKPDCEKDRLCENPTVSKLNSEKDRLSRLFTLSCL